MKAQILLIALLIGSIFAGSLAFATSYTNLQEYNGKLDQEKYGKPNIPSGDIAGYVKNPDLEKSVAKVVSIKDIKGIEINPFEKEQILEKAESYEDKLKIGFSKSWRGTGYIDNDESGYLISGFWTIQKFAKSNDSDDNEIIERGFGRLKIAGLPNYHLVIKDQTNNSFSFYVLPNNKGGINAENAEDNAVGTLELTIDKEFIGLTIWNGKLSLTEGDLAGTWDVFLATDQFVVKPQQKVHSYLFPAKVDLEDFDKDECQNALAGDANSDGKLDISDAVFIGMYLRGQAELNCSNTADVNADGKINQEDIEYILDYLFKGGPAPVKASKSDIEEKLQDIESEEDKIEFGDDVKVVKKITPVKKGFWQRFIDFFKFK